MLLLFTTIAGRFPHLSAAIMALHVLALPRRNATLAGGIAVGMICHMIIGPGGAMVNYLHCRLPTGHALPRPLPAATAAAAAAASIFKCISCKEMHQLQSCSSRLRFRPSQQQQQQQQQPD